MQDLKDANGDPIFKIGHGNIGETSTPSFYPLVEESIFIVDAAGLCDSNANRELPNVTSVQRVMKESS